MADEAATGPLTVLVAVKHVPVGGAFLKLVPDGLTREGVSHGIDPLNEVGLEWALRLKEQGRASRVVAVCMGPPDAVDTLRRALAIGADEIVLVSDPALEGSDVRTTARALAAVARRYGADVVVTGYESLDGSSGAVPAATAAFLDCPLVSRVWDAAIREETLAATRDIGSGPESVETELPAVISMVEGHVAPRYPKLKDVLRTKLAEPEQLGAADLGIQRANGERVIGIVEVPMPAREPRVLGFDDGVAELFALMTEGSTVA